MRTRTTILAVAIAAAVLLAAGCYWQAPGGGSTFSIAVGSSASARLINPSANILRVYLMTGGVLFPFGPAAHPLYDEVSFTPGMKYTSPPIVAGLAYSVLVAAGYPDPTSGVFTPTDYGSQDIALYPGSEATLTIPLASSPYILSNLWGKDVQGVAADLSTFDGPLYAYSATDRTLYSEAFVSGSFSFSGLLPAVPGAYGVNSLSMGQEYTALAGYQPTPWLNTSLGILPYSLQSASLVTSFATGAGVQNVTGSASLLVSATDQVAVYRRATGLGGAQAPRGVPSGWVDIELGTPIYDLTSVGDVAFVAAGSGAFNVPGSAFVPAATASTLLAAATSFGVANTTITSLAITPDPTTSYGYVLFMATAKGLFFTPVDSANPSVFPQPIAQVPGVAAGTMHSIKALQYTSYPIAGPEYHFFVAILGDSDVSVYDIFAGSATRVGVLPFYGGLPADVPADITDLAVCDDGGGHLYVVVTGKKGLVAYAALTYSAG
jgi:hypothetical protein